LPALVEALGDPEVQMRRNAALALVFLANPYEPKPRVDTRAAMPALIKATKDADSDVRAWAAHALAEIGPDAAQAVPDLILLLADPTEGPKNTSCMALASIGPAAQTALPALKKALDDPSADVRQFAKAAIGKITAPSTTPKP
jgi:HEAT repeat protein